MSRVRPKKHLGQHFLTDLNIARKIVAALPAEPREAVYEIGPGEGVLTRLLLEKLEKLTVIEVDGESVEHLRSEFAGKNLEVLHQDFLNWEGDSIPDSGAHFIGNLPYNISSPIFFSLLEKREKVRSGVFMVQKEVAERICEGPGSKTYGILSVLLGYYFDLKYQFTVSEKVFRPPPKVKSAVFSMIRKDQPDEVDFKPLLKVVKAAFGQRRKTMRNALKSLNLELGGEYEEILKSRAEQLPIETFVKLAKVLEGA